MPLEEVRPEIDGFPVAVIRVDEKLRTVNANTLWKALADGNMAPGGTDWLSLFEPTQRRSLRTSLRRVLKTGYPAIFEARGARDDRWFEVRVAAVHGGTSNDLLVIALDISKHKAREADLNYEATHDSLTATHNRVALHDQVQFALARALRLPSILSLLYIDIDRFKEINDRFGHGVGDKVLVQAAHRMRLALRPADMLARVGGDEFIALCEAFKTAEEVNAVARRVLDAFIDPIQITPQSEIPVTISIGVTLASGSHWHAKGLIDQADRAMYRAKHAGGNRIHMGSAAGVGVLYDVSLLEAERRD